MATSTVNDIEASISQASRRAGSSAGINPWESADYISFLAGFPDPAKLPIQDIIESTRVTLQVDGDWALQYGAGAGTPALIDELLRKLQRDQGIEAAPENILITNGASQGLALIIEMLVDPGDAIITEAPTWMGAVDNFAAAGAEVHEIASSPEGMNLEQLEQTLAKLQDEGRRAKFIYIIPTFQNPTGVTMPVERRRQLLEIASRFDVPIIEDDAYFDLRYAGDPVPTLYMLDDEARVMYLGTFSKIMSAGMRLGWVVAHQDVISRLISLKSDGGTSPFAGHVAAQFASSGTLVEHINELRGHYGSRRETMLGALAALMPDGVSWTNPEGGFFVWVTLPEDIDINEVDQRCKERGVEICPGPIFFNHGGGGNKMRLSYSFATSPQIEQGIAIIGDVVRDLMESTGRNK